MANEQSQLRLRYLHLRRVPQLLDQIHKLLDKVVSGTAQAHELTKQMNQIIPLSEDHVATSVRMECTAISERVKNLEASLKCWEDILLRVQQLQNTFDDQAEAVENTCCEISEASQLTRSVSISEAPARLKRLQVIDYVYFSIMFL